MKAAEYEDIGRYLKDSRESLRITLAQAAQAMHIRLHYVEALENGDLHLLPGKAYIRGYIKNYATFLGINPAETLDAYDALSASAKQELYIPEPTVSENLPSRSLLVVAGVAILITVMYYVMTLKDGHVAVPAVAEVPSVLLLKAASTKNSRNFLWLQCLNSDVNECFNDYLANDVLMEIDENYAADQRFLSGVK